MNVIAGRPRATKISAACARRSQESRPGRRTGACFQPNKERDASGASGRGNGRYPGEHSGVRQHALSPRLSRYSLARSPVQRKRFARPATRLIGLRSSRRWGAAFSGRWWSGPCCSRSGGAANGSKAAWARTVGGKCRTTGGSAVEQSVPDRAPDRHRSRPGHWLRYANADVAPVCGGVTMPCDATHCHSRGSAWGPPLSVPLPDWIGNPLILLVPTLGLEPRTY